MKNQTLIILLVLNFVGCDDVNYHEPQNHYSELLIKTKQGPSEYKFRGGRGVQIVSICRVDNNENVIDCIENISDLELMRSSTNASMIIRSERVSTCNSTVPQVRLGNRGYIKFNMTSDIVSGDRVRIAVIESPECVKGYEYELYGIDQKTGNESLICEGAFTKSCVVQ